MSGYLVIVAGPMGSEMDINNLPESAKKLQCREGAINGSDLYNTIYDLSAYTDLYGHILEDVFDECIDILIGRGILSKPCSSMYTVTEFDDPVIINQFTFVYIQPIISKGSDCRISRTNWLEQSKLLYMVVLVDDNYDSFTVRVISKNDPIEWDNVIAVFNHYSKCTEENGDNMNIHMMIARLCIIFMSENYDTPGYTKDAKSNIIRFYMSLDTFYTAIDSSFILERVNPADFV
jgi:hypothetical protein